MYKLKIAGIVYFLTDEAHEKLVFMDNPSESEVMEMSLVAIDLDHHLVLKSRYNILDVIENGLSVLA